MVQEVYPTVNPLVYRVRVKWSQPVSVKNSVMVWNLFQKWAGRNGTTPSGRVQFAEDPHPATGEMFMRGFTVEVHIRERLGLPKNDHPE